MRETVFFPVSPAKYRFLKSWTLFKHKEAHEERRRLRTVGLEKQHAMSSLELLLAAHNLDQVLDKTATWRC